jgi:hypothetical protein
MKKTTTSIFTIAIATTASAQSNDSPLLTRHSPILEVLGTIALVAIVMFFILEMIKYLMNYRLKNKIIDKGVSGELASSLLRIDPNEVKNVNIKWFAILAGIGTALLIINYTLPLGLHSLAIMAFCLSASFLGYYLFLRKAGK